MTETLRYGSLKITKLHVSGRTYRVGVLDMSRDPGDRQVWWARETGWTKANRQLAREWIASQSEAVR